MGLPLRILHLEDDPLDAELIREVFAEAGLDTEIRLIQTREEYVAALERGGFDVIIADNRLPSFDGQTALTLAREQRPDVPFIFVSGTIGEELAVQLVKGGATDYVLKENLIRLPVSVRSAVQQAEERAQRKKAEKALVASEEQYRRIVETAAEGIWLVDDQGKTIFVNQKMAEMLRGTVDGLIGASLFDFLDDEDKDTIVANIEWRSLGTPVQREVGFRRKDGTHFWTLLSGSAVYDEEGRYVGALAMVADITERKQAEDALRQTEKLAAMATLVAGVAHELNNPLSVVIGQTFLLREAIKGSPLVERVERIAQAAERSARIVRNFLALARQYPPERQQVKLNQIVQEAVELLAYPLRVDNVEVKLDLVPDLPALWGDPHQLQQVLVNLITNAHQAMRETSAPHVLTLTTRFDPAFGRVSLEVADTGPGIPSPIRARIFEPFFTTKAPGQGTGLGLSLCRGIIEEHKGTIQVMDTPPGGGTLFRIELPVDPRATRREVLAVEAPPVVSGKTILVVDDEGEVAETLKDMLANDGHQVETATNGVIALSKLRERDYDLILSDLKMPELDGPGLYREIARSYPRFRRRVIFITGDALSLEAREFLANTEAHSVGKPFALDEVRRVILQALQSA